MIVFTKDLFWKDITYLKYDSYIPDGSLMKRCQVSLCVNCIACDFVLVFSTIFELFIADHPLLSRR